MGITSIARVLVTCASFGVRTDYGMSRICPYSREPAREALCTKKKQQRERRKFKIVTNSNARMCVESCGERRQSQILWSYRASAYCRQKRAGSSTMSARLNPAALVWRTVYNIASWSNRIKILNFLYQVQVRKHRNRI